MFFKKIPAPIRPILGLALVGLALWLVQQRAGAPNVEETTAELNSPVDQFKPLERGEEAVLFGGDVLWTRDYRPYLKEHGADYPARGLMPLLRSAQASVFVANHEGPITKERAKCPPAKNWNYRSSTRNRKVLPKIGFTHLSLANNHALDRCEQGMQDTIEHIGSVGIATFGAGSTLDEAMKPALFEVGGLKIAVVGGMESWSNYRKADWGATDNQAGIFLLNKRQIPTALERARESADLVIAYPHWGANYRPVSKAQRRLAERLLQGGADMILGHHGHAAQEFGVWRDKPVLWGLGNLLFGTPGRFGHDKMQPGYGLIARLVVKNGEADRIEIIPIMVNNRLVDFQPRVCSVEEANGVLRGLVSEGNQPVRIANGIATLTL